MDDNQTDIRLLQDDPDELIIRYQPLIRIIIRQYYYRGCISRHEVDDLVQDVNRKLIERMPRIQKLYNGRSRFRTYFSVVIKNVFLEEVRKVRMVTEPHPEAYGMTGRETVVDQLVIRQEIERLRRLIRLFGKESPLLDLILRLFTDLPVRRDDLLAFPHSLNGDEILQLETDLNGTLGLHRRQKLMVISQALAGLGMKLRKPDALRKWYTSRLGELLSWMNGDPPHSHYQEETLLILLEKGEEINNQSENFSIPDR